jgi:7,8-dihydropterin-6-yl-methyl-4-(beta-D-ribofuranosyl)aminobenzene 5'-phosphate synthase
MNAQNISITVLVDNSAGSGLAAEHGLALWIDTGHDRIVFDTGQGMALTQNASRLGLDLERANILILSHGHWDHTGGVADVLRKAKKIETFCHPAVMQARYSVLPGEVRSLAISSQSADALKGLPQEKLRWIPGAAMFSPMTGITGEIPRLSDFEDRGGPYYLDQEGTDADQVVDDMALWIDTATGLIVLVGCCHSGLVNTLNYIRQITGHSKIRAVVGGFHLLRASEERLTKTVNALQALAPELIVPCHCTGESAIGLFQDVLGASVVPGRSGLSFQL